MNKKNYLLIGLVTGLYVLGLVFDMPYIRGPFDPIFPSEWPYYYVNTWIRVWMPVFFFSVILIIFYQGYKKYHIYRIQGKIVFWSFFIIFIFLLHLSYVYFSRFGVTVLFQRIVNPGMNGYFSSSVKIETKEYLSNFPEIIEDLDQHARDHPPGSILLIKSTIYLVEKSGVAESIAPLIPIPDGDVRQYWDNLSNAERVSAIFLALFYHFVGAFCIFPVFLIGKLFYSEPKAFSLSLIGGLLPSLSFFALKFDPFYFLLFSVLAYFLLKAIHMNRLNYWVIVGFLIGVCLFFSFSIIPGIAILILYALYSYRKNIPLLVDVLARTMIGFWTLILILLLIGYNSFTAFLPIISNQAPRSYWQWFLYNPFDFFQYLGIPVAFLFFVILVKIKNFKENVAVKNLSIIFIGFFALLVISGISRAEVGRIWLPLMLFPLLALGLYRKFTFQLTLFIAILLFLQNIVMTEFWVPVW